MYPLNISFGRSLASENFDVVCFSFRLCYHYLLGSKSYWNVLLEDISSTTYKQRVAEQ